MANSVEGVGPDAAVVTGDHGGKQSDTPSRLDLVPAKALLQIGAILKQGAAKYGENNWRKIPAVEHLNHALVHAAAYLAGDESDDHAGHFACRAMMFLEQTKTPKRRHRRKVQKSQVPA